MHVTFSLSVIWWLPLHPLIHVLEVFPTGHVPVPYLSLCSVFKVTGTGAVAPAAVSTWISMPRIKFQVLCEMQCSAESLLWKVQDLYKYSLTVMCFSKNTGYFLLTSVVFLAQWYSPPQGVRLWCETLCPRHRCLLERWQKTGSGSPRSTWKKLLVVGLALWRDGQQEAAGWEGFRRKAARVDKGGWECFGLWWSPKTFLGRRIWAEIPQQKFG